MNRKDIKAYCKKCAYSMNVFMLYCYFDKRAVPCEMVEQCPYKAKYPKLFDADFNKPSKYLKTSE